ncbi:MAG: hypothetical protein JWO06_1236 [Bacteroidota bacterium]|nr:hypothetical protein [Bacteroidota bacterium]
MRKYFLSALVFGFISLYYSCTKDKTSNPVTVDCTGVNAATNTYALNIGPNITDLYCAYAPCHDHATNQSGVDLSSYNSTVDAFKSKNVICSIKGNGCLLMPNGGPALADSLIKQVECWAQNGYPQ